MLKKIILSERSMRVRCVNLLFALFLFLPLSSKQCFAQFQGTGDLRIISPAAYTRIEAGTMFTVKWANASYTAKNLHRIKLELYKNTESIHTFVENTFNTGKYTALFLSTFSQGKYRIKITSIDGTAFTFSDEFEIIPAIPVKILQPTLNDTWYFDQEYIIIWQDECPHSQVYINLFRVEENEQLISIERIADGIQNDGHYSYTVPNTLSEGVYTIGIRIPPIAEIKYSKPFTIKKLD